MSTSRAAAPTLARLGRARADQESTVRWLALLSPLLVIAVPVAASRARPAPGLDGRSLLLTMTLAGFAVAVVGRNATAAHRRTPTHLGFVSLLLASAVAMTAIQPSGPGPECLLLATLCVAVVVPGRRGVAVVVVGFAVAFAITAATDRDVVSLVVLTGFAALYGVLFLAYRLVLANTEAQRLLEELERSQAAQAQAAGLAERQRLAREMHDVLAHSLSGLLLQLEGARLLSDLPGTDPRLSGAIHRAHGLAKAGLDEARRAIGALRDDVLPGPESLGPLVEEFTQTRRLPCTLTVHGVARALPSEVRVAMYRVAQEALTNVTKHAPEARRVELRLVYATGLTSLAVEDFGDPSSESSGPSVSSVSSVSRLRAPSRPRDRDGGGYGLTGMRERAELLGASMTAARTDSGFLVELRVPLGDGGGDS